MRITPWPVVLRPHLLTLAVLWGWLLSPAISRSDETPLHEAYKPLFSVNLDTPWVRCVSFNSDGTAIAVCGETKLALMLDATTGKKLADLRPPGPPSNMYQLVAAYAEKPNAIHLVEGYSRHLSLDWKTGRPIGELTSERIYGGVLIHPRRNFLMTGIHEGIEQAQAAFQAPAITMPDHTRGAARDAGLVRSLAINEAGSVFLAGRHDGRIGVYFPFVDANKAKGCFPAHSLAVTDCYLGGKQIVTLGLDGRIRWWEIDFAKPKAELELGEKLAAGKLLSHARLAAIARPDHLDKLELRTVSADDSKLLAVIPFDAAIHSKTNMAFEIPENRIALSPLGDKLAVVSLSKVDDKEDGKTQAVLSVYKVQPLLGEAKVQPEVKHIYRTWIPANGGKSVVAVYIASDDKNVTLEVMNGPRVDVPRGSLSPADQAYLKEMAEKYGE